MNDHPDGKIPQERIQNIVVDVLLAVKATHDAGMLHRDIKMDNLVVTKDSKCQVIDFDHSEVAGNNTAAAAAAATGGAGVSHPPFRRNHPRRRNAPERLFQKSFYYYDYYYYCY